MKIRLEHANLVVRDLDETIRFLKTAFPDFRVRAQGASNLGRWAHVGNDETYIALNTATRPAAEQWQPYSGAPGVNHLGYEVDDVAALERRLSAAGFRNSTFPNAHPHRRRVYFYDAEGNDWEFVEYTSDDPRLRNDYELPDFPDAKGQEA